MMPSINIHYEVTVKLSNVNMASKFLPWIGPNFWEKRKRGWKNIWRYSIAKLLRAEVSEPIYLDFLFLLKLLVLVFFPESL